MDQDQRISPQPTEKTNSVPSSTLSAPSALKSTKAPPVTTTAHARVPYKTSLSLSTRIQSQTVPASSTRQVSFQTNPIQPAPAAALPTKPTDSFQTSSMQSPTALAPSVGPLNSFHTTLMQSPTVPAPSAKPLVLFENTFIEGQTALDQAEVIPVSSQTTPVQPQTLPMPATSVPVPVLTRCFPTQSPTVPKPLPVTTTLVPQNSSEPIKLQVLEPTSSVTTPVPLNPAADAIATSISFQTTMIASSPALSAFTTSSSSSSTQTATTHALSQTTSATTEGPVLALSQVTCVKVPGSTDFSAASKSPVQLTSEQSASAGVPTPLHVPHSITPPAQPSSSLAPFYPVGFGTPLPYPPYPAPMPSLSPNISAPLSDPCLPSAVPTPPFSHAGESYLYEPAGSPVAGRVVYVLSCIALWYLIFIIPKCQDFHCSLLYLSRCWRFCLIT